MRRITRITWKCLVMLSNPLVRNKTPKSMCAQLHIWKCIKQNLAKVNSDLNKSTIILGDFIASLLIANGTT